MPSARTGTIPLTTTAAYFVAGMANNHVIRYQNSQIQITVPRTAPTQPASFFKPCPAAQSLGYPPGTQNGSFYVGEITINENGVQGQITAVSGGGITVTYLSEFEYSVGQTISGPHGP